MASQQHKEQPMLSVLSESGESKQPESGHTVRAKKGKYPDHITKDNELSVLLDDDFFKFFYDDQPETDCMEQNLSKEPFPKYTDSMNLKLSIKIPQTKKDIFVPFEPCYKYHLKMIDVDGSITEQIKRRNKRIRHKRHHLKHKRKQKKAHSHSKHPNKHKPKKSGFMNGFLGLFGMETNKKNENVHNHTNRSFEPFALFMQAFLP